MPIWLVRMAIVLAISLAGYLTFELGRIQAGYNVVDVATEEEDFRQRVHDLEAETVSLKEQIALLETHRDIDREAYKDVEANLGRLQRKIQEQRDAIEFYRGIISPADGGRGLRVQELKVEAGKSEREFNLRVVLVQVKQHDRSVKGEVAFSVDGEQNGSAKTYTLAELLPDKASSAWSYAFRYFQDFDRQLVLPDGFTPETINIEVRSQTKSIASVKQSFQWQVSQT